MDDVDAIPAKLVGGIERKAKTADIDVEAVPELPLSRVASVRRKPVMPRAERTTSRVARAFAESRTLQVGVHLVSSLDWVRDCRAEPAPRSSLNQAGDAGQAFV
jgi:hypothetical protein